MSSRNRARRSGEGFPSPRAIRQVAFIATGWAVFSVIAAVYFSTALAPAVGRALDLHFASKTGPFDMHVATDVLAATSIWVAAVLVVLALGAVVVSRSRVKLSYVVSVIVSFVTPLYFGVVLPNGWAAVADPGRDNGWLQAGVGLVGLVGLAVGGISFTAGPGAIDRITERVAAHREIPPYESPAGRDES
jgi:hypothetical protein